MNAHRLKKVMHYIGVVAAVTVIVAAVFLTLARIALSYADNYQTVFEKWATQIVERPIHIKKVKGSWYGLNPVISFKKVFVLDRSGKHVLLSVKTLRIGIDVFNSLIHWKLEPDYVEVVGSHVRLVRGKTGKIELNQIKSFDVNNETGQASEKSFLGLMDWLLTRSNIVLKDLDVKWQGARKREVYVTNLSAHVVNDQGAHDIDGEFSLANHNNTKVRFIVKFSGEINSHYHAKTYLELQNIDMPNAFLNKKQFHKVNIQGGKINAKLWLNIEDNVLGNVQTDFDVKDIVLRAPETGKMFKVNRLKANVSAEHENAIWHVNADKVLLETNNVKWPELRFSLDYASVGGSVALKNANLNYINVNEFKKFIVTADFVSHTLVKRLDSVVFSGLGENLMLAKGGDNQYQLSAEYKHLSIQGIPYLPTLTDMTGTIKVNKQDNLVTSHFNFVSPYLNSQGDVSVLIDQIDNPLLNVDTKINFKDFSKLHELLPSAYVSEGVVTYMKEGLLSGRGSGDLVIKGRAQDFPFQNKPGKLEFNLAFDNVALNFYKHWPHLKKISGTLDLHNNALKIIADKAVFLNMPLSQLNADIKNLSHPILKVSFKDKTDSRRLVALIHSTPLRDSVGERLKLFNIKSKVSLTTDVITDLSRSNPSVNVRGRINFLKGSIAVPKLNLNVKDVIGALSFNDMQVDAKNVHGVLFDRPMIFSINNAESNGRGALHIGVSAKLPVTFWSKYVKSGLPTAFKGTTQYNALVTLWDDGAPTTVKLSSDLKGATVALPTILNKPKQKSVPSSLTLYFDNKVLTKGRLLYGKTLDAQMQFKPSVAHQKQSSAINAVSLKQIHFNIDTSTVQGELLYTPSRYRGQLTGHFDYFNLEKLSHETSHFDPRTIPKINITCDDFQYRNRPLGKLTLLIDPLKDGVRMAQVRTQSPTFNFLANGLWTVDHDKEHTSLKGSFNTTNLGSLLKYWDFTDNLARGRGRSTFDLAWQGRPQDFNVKSLDGYIDFHFNDGRVTHLPKSAENKVDIGRALSVLSLQTLPRRLSLNFRDLTHKGFSYDVMLGEFAIEKGVLVTHRAYLKGPVARISVDGQIDMVKKDFHAFMTVTAYYMNGLPIVATIVGGPIAGIATWAAGKVLSKPIHKLTTHRYAITGDWAHPEWHQIRAKR